MANNFAAKKGGASPGKLALIGVLTVSLLGVLYYQYGGSSETPTAELKRPAGRRPAPIVTPVSANAKATDKNKQIDKASLAPVAAAVDETKWKSPNLAEVVDYDPFALPPTFPKPSVAGAPAGKNGAELVAAADADDAKRIADALAESEMQLEELKQRGVQVIVRERDQYVAMIGDRTVHVGDEIDGFTVTQIDQQGVHIERKGKQ